MKKVLLLLTSSLLLVACNKTPKFDLQTIKPFVPVEIPEAHQISKEEALTSTTGYIQAYDYFGKDYRFAYGDFVFHGETRNLIYDSIEQRTSIEKYLIDYRNINNIELSFTEQSNNLFNEVDTLLVHKQTKDYGNVLFVNKIDPDFREHYIIAYTEKETPFSAGSMSSVFRHFVNEKMSHYYNNYGDYNKFFEFVDNKSFNHTVKFASRGRGSLILETASTATSEVSINSFRIDEIKFKMEYFEYFLVGYEYKAFSNSQVVKSETLSLTYERPEIELPDYWKLHIK